MVSSLFLFALGDYFERRLLEDFRKESIAKHDTVILESKSTLTNTLQIALQDLDFLRRELETIFTAKSGEFPGQNTLTKLHSNFILSRPAVYDHIRFIDHHGQEMVRVNGANGDAVIVDPAELQNKKGRYYFTEMLNLERDHVYLSPIDLNIEHGEIELPLNPVMRIGTPVFLNEGKVGVSIINLSFAHLTRYMKEIGARVNQGVWLVNAQGYWLLGSRQEDEWGFVFSDRAEANLKSSQSRLWKQMSTGQSHGSLDSEDGIYTYEKISLESLVPRTRLILDQMGNHWYVVSYTDQSQLNDFNQSMNALVTPSFVALWLFISALCFWLGHAIQKRTEAFSDLQQSEAHLNTVFENAPDAVVISHANGLIQYINHEAENLFGYPRNELIGRPIEKLLPKRLHSDHVRYRKSYIQQPRRREMGEGVDLVAVHRTGQEIPVKISLSYIESTKGNYVIANVRDFTTEVELQKSRREQEQLFSQQSKMAAMGEMIAAIAHQWKQPLNVLSGVLMNIQDAFNHQSLAKQYLDQQMEIADDNLQYMSSTIDDFSDFLNPASATDRFELSQAFDGVQRITDAQLKDQSIRLNLVDLGQAVKIDGIKSEFIQALISLINNAKDAIVSAREHGRKAGTISLTPHVEAGCLMIDVLDDGCGIPDDISAKIFEPYFSTKQSQKNSGIGLYLTKTILNKKFDTALELVVESENNTQFRLTVPEHKFSFNSLEMVPGAGIEPARSQ